MRLDDGQIEVMDDALVEVLRAKTGAERLAIAWGMWSSVRKMLMAHLRHEHPDWSEEAVARETARRMSHGAV
jgi:hypothetical protein